MPKNLPTIGDSSVQEGKYLNLLKHNTINVFQNLKPPNVALTLIKKTSYNNGILRITWTEEEVK